MITDMVPDSARRVITPADALNLAYDAHHMVQAFTRRTPLGRRIELVCSCLSVITRPTEDATFDAWHAHLGDCADTFLANLVDPMWLGTAMATLTPDDERLDRLAAELAAQAALGDVTPPDDSTAAWLARTSPLNAEAEDRQHPCGCLAYGTDTYGHQLGCDGPVTR